MDVEVEDGQNEELKDARLSEGVEQPQAEDVEGKRRFCLELEFVQCLSNPAYLEHLAGQQFFRDDRFVRYLKYLLYWKRPEYAKFLIFPLCLYFLELLQRQEFRERLGYPDFINHIYTQQLHYWQYRAVSTMRDDVATKGEAIAAATMEMEQRNTNDEGGEEEGMGGVGVEGSCSSTPGHREG